MLKLFKDIYFHPLRINFRMVIQYQLKRYMLKETML